MKYKLVLPILLGACLISGNIFLAAFNKDIHSLIGWLLCLILFINFSINYDKK